MIYSKFHFKIIIGVHLHLFFFCIHVFIARDTLLCITEYVILLRIGEILLLHLSIIRGNMDALNGFMQKQKESSRCLSIMDEQHASRGDEAKNF